MKVNNLPLQDLFDKLRESGFMLGIDDYELLLQALMSGFGISEQDPLGALARVCKTLWVKNHQDNRIFDDCFKQVMSQEMSQPTVLVKSANIGNIQNTENTENIDKPLPDLPIPKEDQDLPPPPEPLNGEDELVEGSDRDIDEEPEKTEPTPSSDVTLKMRDEVQVAQTKQRQSIDWEPDYQYLLSSDYLPLTQREMKQTWRYLRRPRREGAAIELDVEETVEQIAQQGFFLAPVLVPQRVNRVELVLLLDVEGSMVPFHSLGERVKETAIRGGRLGRSQLYYFHNCPVVYLYTDPEQREAERLEDLLIQLSPSHSCVLIFSDAGAARGGYSEDRLERTELFLQKFQQRLRYVAWLNPVPKYRWRDTTAEEISKLVPMFNCDRLGLQNAVKILRGHFIPSP